MKNWKFLILFIIISCKNKVETIKDASNENPIETKEETKNENTNGQDISWEGSLNEKTPVFIHYQIKDKLVVGEITYLNTKNKKPIPLIGEIEEDGNFRLLEFETNGNITGIIVGVPKEQEFNGSWFSPLSRKELKLKLSKKDTSIISTEIETNISDIYGDYHYEYGEKGFQGDFSISKLNKEEVEFNIFSVTSDPSRNIAEIENDTIKINEPKFTYLVPESDSCEFAVCFYKNFAYVRYTKGYCVGQFGHNATIDGIFYKTENKKIDVK